MRLELSQCLRRIGGFGILLLLAHPACFGLNGPEAKAQSRELNLYSARHYGSDNALYEEFTKKTGIKVNQIQAGDEALLERLKSEGKASPADVILLVDVARLWKAQTEGLFAPVRSEVLNAALPLNMRTDNLWFGLTTRARLIVYDKSKIKPEQVSTYDSLANPDLKGKVCTRSGSHPYMLSLLASIVAHQGEAKAEAWAKGVVNNLARTPRGGDTDQIRGVMTGECAVALTNSYYLVRLLNSEKTEEKTAAQRLGIVWPNQSTTGTHVNVSGGGMARYAPHPEAAKAFLEFLVSPSAQAQLANANNEWPAVQKTQIVNPALLKIGRLKADPIEISKIAVNQTLAARLMDRAGWK